MSAISGMSARGMPKTIAMRSMTKDMSSTGWVARYRKPSMTERRPGEEPAITSTGSEGREITARRVAKRKRVSTR